jgi:hypothetical protein
MDPHFASPPEPPQPHPAPPLRPKRWRLSRLWPVAAGAGLGLLMRLVFSGNAGEAYTPMMASFLFLVPAIVGATAVFIDERSASHSSGRHFGLGAIANLAFVAGTFAVMMEGLICAILIVPLFMLVGGVGGVLMGLVCRRLNRPDRTLYSLAALPLLLGGFEQHLVLPTQVNGVERVRIVAASPEGIWQQLENAHDIQPGEVGDAWMYRIGVPLPQAGLTEQTPAGPVRHVTMGRGVHFDQVARQWRPREYVRWTYRFTEDSFPPGALDDHVRIGGHYFDLIDTEYTLTPRGDGRTELRIGMHYRVSTMFNWYAQPIARWLIGNFEEVILGFYARRAEAVSAAAR